ncbi:hypothetical protein [Alteromonas stellipolaris]|uniref:DUF2970 domain-containing protein n=1 Tax=Alteromonas stellipolaris TaxID=233316 RepID=A0ABN4LRV7_9ALTE|nr:hypothetical protein AVL57_00840 [Alteromonas stellipolaris]
MFRKIGAILTKNQFYEVVNDDDNSGLKDDEVMGEMSFFTLISIVVASVFVLVVLGKLLFVDS